MFEIWVSRFNTEKQYVETYVLQKTDEPEAAFALFEDCINNINNSGGLLKVEAAINAQVFDWYPTIH